MNQDIKRQRIFNEIYQALESAESLEQFLTWGQQYFSQPSLDAVIKDLVEHRISSEYNKKSLLFATNHILIWAYLLNLGLDINVENRYGHTILSTMITQRGIANRLTNIRFLLEHGADVDLTTSKNNTSIFQYAMNHPKVIPILIEYGVNYKDDINMYLNLSLYNYQSKHLNQPEKLKYYLDLILSLSGFTPDYEGYDLINTVIRYNSDIDFMVKQIRDSVPFYHQCQKDNTMDLFEQECYHFFNIMKEVVSKGYLAILNILLDPDIYQHAIMLLDAKLNSLLYYAIDALIWGPTANPLLISQLIHDSKDRLHLRNVDGISPYDLLIQKLHILQEHQEYSPCYFPYQYTMKIFQANSILALEIQRHNPEVFFHMLPIDILRLIENYL
jgi:hypothetical protein